MYTVHVLPTILHLFITYINIHYTYICQHNYENKTSVELSNWLSRIWEMAASLLINFDIFY